MTHKLTLNRETLGAAPRTYDGLNALALVLSERHPSAVMCAQPGPPLPAARACTTRARARFSHARTTLACYRRRPTDAHFALEPSAASPALDIHFHRQPQQWETPWEVIEHVHARWPIAFDACASPLNAIAPRYATEADDIRSLELRDTVVFLNPPYAIDRNTTGCSGIGPILMKLVDQDVRQRGCTLIALLPVLSHHGWFQTHVLGVGGGGGGANEIYWLSRLLKWSNLFEHRIPSSPYIYPFVLVVWRPQLPSASPAQHSLSLAAAPPRDHHSRSLHLRRCRRCSRVRVLPRYVDPATLPPEAFECSQSPDVRYASCEAPEYMFHF